MLERLFENLDQDIQRFLVLIVKISKWLVYSGLILLVIFIGINLYHYPNYFTKKFSMSHTGQFGDYVGGVIGTLFTLVTAILLFGTLLINSKQMEMQREELNRAEESIRMQNFENTLYNMIRIQREIHIQINYNIF